MTERISVGAVHHIRLTVTDVKRSREFYTNVLGFQVAVEAAPDKDHPEHEVTRNALQNGVVLINGTFLLGLRPGKSGIDRFDEQRVGLDHLSFHVGSLSVLEKAVKTLDEWKVPHGEIQDLGKIFQLHILEFRDPDNIQLELSAPYS